MKDVERLVAEIDAKVAACDPTVVTEHTASRLACFVRDNWPTLRAAIVHDQQSGPSAEEGK